MYLEHIQVGAHQCVDTLQEAAGDGGCNHLLVQLRRMLPAHHHVDAVEVEGDVILARRRAAKTQSAQLHYAGALDEDTVPRLGRLLRRSERPDLPTREQSGCALSAGDVLTSGEGRRAMPTGADVKAAKRPTSGGTQTRQQRTRGLLSMRIPARASLTTVPSLMGLATT